MTMNELKENHNRTRRNGILLSLLYSLGVNVNKEIDNAINAEFNKKDSTESTIPQYYKLADNPPA